MDSHARSGWFINDLHRHPLPYYFIKTVFHDVVGSPQRIESKMSDVS